MARPQVADGGVASNMEVAAKILKQQLRTADKRWSSSWGFGQGADNSSPEKLALLQNRNMCLGPRLLLWYKLSNGKGT